MLNYADQRYYTAAYGRFNTADPNRASAGPSEPGSWNRYSYVEGDPINFNDRSGQMATLQDGCFSAQYQDSCYDGSTGTTYSAGSIDPNCTQIDWDPEGAGTMNCYGGLLGSGVFLTFQSSTQSPPPPIYCEPDVIKAMITAWNETQNGMSGKEAGFAVTGTSAPGAYAITPTGAYTSQTRCQANILDPEGTFAIFHVHPNGCQPQPSPGDIAAANSNNFDIYTFSGSGLWEYDPVTEKSTELRDGLSWTKPCPQ